MSNAVLVWRVVDWDGRYESSQSLKKTGPLSAVPVATDLSRSGLRRLLGRPESAEILGVWYVLQMLAAQGSRRGVLCSFGRPLTTQDVANLSGFDIPLIERAIEVLAGADVGLLEQVALEKALEPPVIEPRPPRKPRKPKPRAFARCPVCDADLVSLAESEEFQHLLIPEDDCGCDAGCDGDCDCGAECDHDDGDFAGHGDHQPESRTGAKAVTVKKSTGSSASSDCARISDMRRRFEAGEASPEEVHKFLDEFHHSPPSAKSASRPAARPANCP